MSKEVNDFLFEGQGKALKLLRGFRGLGLGLGFADVRLLQKVAGKFYWLMEDKHHLSPLTSPSALQ